MDTINNNVDLIISSVTAPSSVILDSSIFTSFPIDVSFTVSNIGSQTATKLTDDQVFLSEDEIWDGDDIYLTTFENFAGFNLEGGKSYTKNGTIPIPVNITTGDYNFIFIADPINEQPEINDFNNNTFVVPFSVSNPRLDGDINLVITSTDSPSSVFIGEEFDVSWEITNLGSDIPDSVEGKVYLSDDPILDTEDTIISSLNSEFDPNIAIDDFNYNLIDSVGLFSEKIGSKYLIFTADRGFQNTSLTTRLDTLAVPIATTIPDLDNIVTSANISPTFSDNRIDISYTVTKQGTVSFEDTIYNSIDSRFYFSDDEILDDGDINIGFSSISIENFPEEESNYTETARLFIGNVSRDYPFIIIETDSSSIILESNESNNTLAIPYSPPTIDFDLIVTEAIAPSEALLGETIDVSWTVNNRGSLTPDIFFEIQDKIFLSTDEILDESDILINSFVASRNESNYTQNQSILLPSNISQSSQFLIFATDRNRNGSFLARTLPESNEDNNTLAIPISFLNIPDVDLIVTEAIAPSSIILGENFDISWTVTNQGTESTNFEIIDRVYLSSDPILDNSDVLLTNSSTDNGQDNIPNNLVLNPEDSYSKLQNISIEANSTTVGSSYLLFVTNNDESPFNTQPEIDANNNTFALPIEIISSQNIIGSELSETIKGNALPNIIRGLGAADRIMGGRGNDRIFGNSGNDNLKGNKGNDFLKGGNGNDRLIGGIGKDLLNGDNGNDFLSGGSGNDTLNGGVGRDTLQGGFSNDLLHGNNGNDILRGRNGNDTLIGGSGNDTLFGNSGLDVFVIPQNNTDIIKDFTDGIDKLSLPNSFMFTDLTIVNNGTSTEIKNGDRVLAIIENIDANLIDIDDFVE